MIGRLASRSHGVVTRRELLDAGVTIGEIKHRLGTGALLIQHPGVYRVGHEAPSTEARYMAAVKACGDGATLTDRAAAHLYSLTRGAPPPPEVTAPTYRRVKGVVAHRRDLHTRETTTFRGIPVTTVPRTLTDIAGTMSADDLARTCREAGVKYGTTPRHVNEAIAPRPCFLGVARLRAVTAGDEPVKRATDGRRVDCRWEIPPLTVELDSYRFHNSRHSWEHDRRREREARARKDEFRRYSYADVCEDVSATLAELRGLLGPSA